MAYISSVERIGIRKGLEQGLRQGLEQGREDMAGMLREQLETRFGRLDAADLDRLQAADSTTLRSWARRLIEARTLDSIWHQ
ncbi:flagellar biosynthesis/type III secretory pathway protein FliH [Kerstersia gyiorum]|nr:flagellar biosynthesis/type III secretory pathway protein FliH [Kerstersia gyiorum]MCP1672214.1 flagellar biosynthesis/type III secretory pathway protein FliH [Kerstersia gyiorum]MCP1679708.1 flagellar biosynthesis/type III secretory pathway protein FliH [Kerstersia gyiorum]MCP1710095.1 flagellar biosynthesis/type III secretory pathway protein FliH [Kerstersia gyiorum]MCP1713088.1 flagellar biosynthesis/type III secretory pathway protein FliH [Kerstersia gyiorum]